MYEYLLTEDQIEDINEDISIILDRNSNEKTIQDINKKWSEKHPILSNLFVGILLIIIGLFADLAKDYIMTTSSKVNVYIEGNNNSAIVYTLPENSDVVVIDNSKNYYKVLHTDIENNIDIEGYIAKRNLKSKKQ